MKNLFKHLPGHLLPDRAVHGRRVEEIINERAWLKFSVVDPSSPVRRKSVQNLLVQDVPADDASSSSVADVSITDEETPEQEDQQTAPFRHAVPKHQGGETPPEGAVEEAVASVSESREDLRTTPSEHAVPKDSSGEPPSEGADEEAVASVSESREFVFAPDEDCDFWRMCRETVEAEPVRSLTPDDVAVIDSVVALVTPLFEDRDGHAGDLVADGSDSKDLVAPASDLGGSGTTTVELGPIRPEETGEPEASDVVPFPVTASREDTKIKTDDLSEEGSGPMDEAELPPAMTSDVVRGFQPDRKDDLSSVLGFSELARGAREAVREIVDETSHDAREEADLSTHWMAVALRRAGVPRADDLPISPEMDATEAWQVAQEWCRLSGDEIAGMVARLFRVRAVDLSSAKIERMDEVPDSLMVKHRAIPIAQGKRYLVLAVSDPSNTDLERAFSFVTRRSVALTVAPPDAIADAVWNTYGWMF